MNLLRIHRRLGAWSWPTLAAIVLAASALACEGDTTGTGGTKLCNLVESQPPKRVTTGSGKGTIEAAVTAYCDPPPASHKLVVWLEREGSDGKTFFQVGQGEKSYDIPPARGKRYPVSTICVEGYWRVRPSAEGTDTAGNPYTFVLPVKESTISRITCPLQ